MKVWVAYDRSRAHLPIAVADTLAELAAITGRTETHIKTVWSKYKHGIVKNTCFAQVEIEEDTPC